MNGPNTESGYNLNHLNTPELQLFRSKEVNPQGKTVLFGAVDSGDGALLNAAAARFSERGWNVQVLAKGRAAGIFSADQRFQEPKGNPIEEVSKKSPDVVFTGMSSEPEFGGSINIWGSIKGARKFAAGDYPGAYGNNMKEQFQADIRAVPEAAFVLDARAAAVEDARFSKFGLAASVKFIASGNPVLDQIATSNKGEIRERTRNKLGVPNNVKLISWFGQIGMPSVESLSVVLAGLHETEMKDWMLAVRFHPRDNNASNGVYEQMLDPFKRRLVWATGNVEPDANNVIVASDLIFQEKSTIALQAAAWEIIAASIVVPEIERGKIGEMSTLWVPMIENRVSPLITNINDMRVFMDRYNRDSHYVDILNRRMAFQYKQTGGAADTIVDNVEMKLAA